MTVKEIELENRDRFFSLKEESTSGARDLPCSNRNLVTTKGLTLELGVAQVKPKTCLRARDLHSRAQSAVGAKVLYLDSETQKDSREYTLRSPRFNGTWEAFGGAQKYS